MDSTSFDALTFARFTEVLGSRFQTGTSASAQVELELIAVTPGNTVQAGANSARFESFSLLFRGPSAPVLGQGTYPFVSERLGKFDLFIVPIGKTAAGVEYQAIFNRQIKEG